MGAYNTHVLPLLFLLYLEGTDQPASLSRDCPLWCPPTDAQVVCRTTRQLSAQVSTREGRAPAGWRCSQPLWALPTPDPGQTPAVGFYTVPQMLSTAGEAGSWFRYPQLLPSLRWTLVRPTVGCHFLDSPNTPPHGTRAWKQRGWQGWSYHGDVVQAAREAPRGDSYGSL